jgi:hypothetical protein
MGVLIAFLIVLATTIPAAMAMSSAVNGMAGDQHCPSCPQQTGHMNSDKMPACQILACVGPLATLPAPGLVHGQAFFRVAYVQEPPAHLTDAGPAPDPFPPRSIVLL